MLQTTGLVLRDKTANSMYNMTREQIYLLYNLDI